LLEVGCGEGHQSLKLLEICSHLYGIDVSRRAVERATQRCPTGSFGVGDVFNSELLNIVPRFDLVVACEVLYYMKDIPATIARLSSLGRWCLVTYYERPSEQLDPHLTAIADVQTTALRYKATVWKAYWWQNH
jgi:trans-aconitate methyltransferase